MIVPRHGFSVHPAEVPCVAPSIAPSIGIEDFPVPAEFWHSDSVMFEKHRWAVGGNNKEIVALFRAPKERENAGIRVIAINPLEPCPVEVHLVERGFPR